MNDAEPSSTTQTPVPEMARFASALQSHPLRFSMHEGRVESVCSAEAEKTWVLNVKRSIISGLQMTVPKDLTKPTMYKEVKEAMIYDDVIPLGARVNNFIVT